MLWVEVDEWSADNLDSTCNDKKCPQCSEIQRKAWNDRIQGLATWSNQISALPLPLP